MAPGRLQLTLVKGKAATGVFVISAMKGPVSHFTVSVPVRRVTVTPAAGSLVAGGYVTVTVRVTGLTPLTTRITVDPGDITVVVVVTVKT